MTLPYTTTLPITSSSWRLDITDAFSSGNQPSGNSGDPTVLLVGLRKRISDYLDGALASNIQISTALTFASGIFTITSGNLSANDTVTVGGITFTAKSSGAAGAQFNIGGTAALTATALAAIIDLWTNTSSNNGTVGMVTAVAGTSGSSGTVTVRSAAGGSIGNAIATTKSATNGSWGAATLTGGTSPSVFVNSLGL